MIWPGILKDPRFHRLTRKNAPNGKPAYECQFDGSEFWMPDVSVMAEVINSCCQDPMARVDDRSNWLDILKDDRFTEARRITGDEPAKRRAGREGFAVWFDGIEFKAHTAGMVYLCVHDYCEQQHSATILDESGHLREQFRRSKVDGPVRDSVLMGIAYERANKWIADRRDHRVDEPGSANHPGPPIGGDR